MVMQGTAHAAPSVGKVTYLSGEGSRAGTDGQAITLKSGDSLLQGDSIKTAKGSRLEATLSDGSVLRMGASSQLALQNVKVGKRRKKRSVRAKLFVGRVWAAVTSFFGRSRSFEVVTENAVAGVRGTRFSASRDTSGTTTVKVYSGKVLVSNKPVYAVKGHTKDNRRQVAGPQEVSKKKYMELLAGAMQMITVASGGEVSQPKAFEMASAADDDWEAWNAERDKLAGLEE